VVFLPVFIEPMIRESQGTSQSAEERRPAPVIDRGWSEEAPFNSHLERRRQIHVSAQRVCLKQHAAASADEATDARPVVQLIGGVDDDQCAVAVRGADRLVELRLYGEELIRIAKLLERSLVRANDSAIHKKQHGTGRP